MHAQSILIGKIKQQEEHNALLLSGDRFRKTKSEMSYELFVLLAEENIIVTTLLKNHPKLYIFVKLAWLYFKVENLKKNHGFLHIFQCGTADLSDIRWPC